MKSITLYTFVVAIIFIDLIFMKYIHVELLDIIFLMSLFNIVTFPVIYGFITMKTIVSSPSEKYNVFCISNSRVNKKTTQTINELLYILKQPITILLFSFPFLFLLNHKVGITVFTCINIVFLFFAFLNLLIISILIKSFYEGKFFILLCMLNILITTTSATVSFINENMFNITLSLVGLSFLSILFMVYFIKRNSTGRIKTETSKLS